MGVPGNGIHRPRPHDGRFRPVQCRFAGSRCSVAGNALRRPPTSDCRVESKNLRGDARIGVGLGIVFHRDGSLIAADIADTSGVVR